MSEHATELRERVEVRINEFYCIQPGCDYNGKEAVQGHCFSRLDDDTDRYLARLEKSAEEVLTQIHEHHGEDYVKTLESYFLSAWMNCESTIDQLVRLRRENAALKLRIEQLSPEGRD